MIQTPIVEEEDNVVQFERPVLKLLPKDPDDPIWLNNLGIGTQFLVSKKNSQDFSLEEFVVEGRTEKATYLLWIHEAKNVTEHKVIPNRFCRIFDLYEILRTEEEYLVNLKAQEELTNKDTNNG